MAATGDDPHALGFDMDRESIAVLFDFKGPIEADRRSCLQQSQAWLDAIGHGIEREVGLGRIALDHGCLEEVGRSRKPDRQMSKPAKPLLQDNAFTANSKPRRTAHLQFSVPIGIRDSNVVFSADDETESVPPGAFAISEAI
jgi:hypothetical protein